MNKNAQPGTSVYKLTAEDADSGNNGEIVFEIKSLEVPFDIDPTTSEIKTTSLVTLTKEVCCSVNHWYFTIEWVGMILPSLLRNR